MLDRFRRNRPGSPVAEEPQPNEGRTKPMNDELIPLSHLELDLDPPSGAGWPAYLAAKGVELLSDDVGRAAVSRVDARRLFTERREAEARGRELTERREVELEAQRLASLPR